MTEMLITRNAVENLINEYAIHKTQENLARRNADYNELSEDTEFMYHAGFCRCAESWLRSIGISLESPMVEKMIRKHT
jgi:hypothetical protein